MGEESHVDAMRDAIRGDFERLKQRRGAQELMRVADPGPPPGEVPAGTVDERGDDEPSSGRGWLARLLSR